MTVPYFDDEYSELFESGMRAARDEDGKTVYVPEDMKYPEWKEKFVKDSAAEGVAKSKESGIMKSGSDAMALENQRYGRNKQTLVNHTYIESGEYRRKFDKATDNKEVNKALYDSAKMALKHRSGTVFEDMYWIDGDTGEIIAKELENNEPRKVAYSSKTKKTVTGAKPYSIVALHSHPSSMPPSAADFNSCYKNKYKMGFVSCHNGKVFAYTANEPISEKIYNIYIENYVKEGYDEFDAQVLAIKKLSVSYDIKMWEVK